MHLPTEISKYVAEQTGGRGSMIENQQTEIRMIIWFAIIRLMGDYVFKKEINDVLDRGETEWRDSIKGNHGGRGAIHLIKATLNRMRMDVPLGCAIMYSSWIQSRRAIPT